MIRSTFLSGNRDDFAAELRVIDVTGRHRARNRTLDLSKLPFSVGTNGSSNQRNVIERPKLKINRPFRCRYFRRAYARNAPPFRDTPRRRIYIYIPCKRVRNIRSVEFGERVLCTLRERVRARGVERFKCTDIDCSLLTTPWKSGYSNSSRWLEKSR